MVESVDIKVDTKMNSEDLLKTINALKERANNTDYSAPMTDKQKQLITIMNRYCNHKCDLSATRLIAEDYIIKNFMEYRYKALQEEWS